MRMPPDLHRSHEVHTHPSTAVIVSIASKQGSGRKRGDVRSRLTVFTVRLLLVQLHSHCSRLRQDSYHGNVRGRPSVTVQTQREIETGREGERERDQTKGRQGAFLDNGKKAQPIKEQSLASDSWHSQSRNALAWQKRLFGSRLNGMCWVCVCEEPGCISTLIRTYSLYIQIVYLFSQTFIYLRGNNSQHLHHQ